MCSTSFDITLTGSSDAQKKVDENVVIVAAALTWPNEGYIPFIHLIFIPMLVVLAV